MNMASAIVHAGGDESGMIDRSSGTLVYLFAGR